MERRSFLIALAAGIQASFQWPRSARGADGKGTALLCTSAPGKDDHSILQVFDWDAFKARAEFTVPIAGAHSLVRDHTDHNVVFVLERSGSILRFDMATGKSVKVDASKEGVTSAGHAVQTPSGEFIFCTENDRKLGQIVSLRSSRTLKRIEVAPPECNGSHQAILMPGASILACGGTELSGPGISAGGGVTFYDFEKKKVLNRIPLDMPVVHLASLSQTEVLAGGVRFAPKEGVSRTDSVQWLRYMPGPLYYVNMDGTKKKIWDEKEPDLFCFNFAIVPLRDPGALLTSHMASGKVLLWKNNKIAHQWDVREPTVILASKNQKEFMVHTGVRAKTFSLETFAEVATIAQTDRQIHTLAGY